MKLYSLVLAFLAVLWPACGRRIFFRRPASYNTFMRQVTVNYEKAKVETLGDIFKRHVQQLRSTRNKQVELVFLIDSSGTVGRYYFYEEIRFVKNLLADFTVDVNATRVSVITFSSPNKIFRHIDYLSKPDTDNHKCRLLNEDIPHVDYTPGGTHTLGAFLEAEKVLRSARPDASKAIFLMTDGYSNGGDPRPVANKLKKQGVKIFTFGIRDGFVWELQDMASEPKNETCYILDSFEEFEALAKRALHADLQSGSYIEQSMSKCSSLCRDDGLCCHDNATCTCGTYTGKYECLCKPGYYGIGRGKTGCKPCPPGTYKNYTGIGDVNVCTPCPDEHQTTPEGAMSVQLCKCKRGYRSFGNRECTVFRCPELSPPKHGYFVNNKCNNVFNAACGLRCQHGYELRGSSLRICQDDGTWSGQDAECIMKTCPSLPTPKNGHMICSSDDFSYSSVCRFTCNAGYQLVGSRKRTCLAIAYWTGIATRCREITCPPLVEIKDGTITPASCTTREVVFGSTCQISCSAGYTLKGPHTKQCTPDGTWMVLGQGINQCIDETPPVLHCPDNMEVTADEFEEMTEVSWTAPVPVDNSGFRPVLTSDPAVVPGSRFPIGITVITYKAEDLSQNVAICKFYIHVIDKTPPTVDKCVSPSPVVSKTNETEIVLEPPLFSDNSGKPVEVAPSHMPGELFPWGTTVVTYKAFDSSNNNITCSVDVVVIPHLCVIPEPPVNGNASCEEGEIGVLCYVTCEEGYAFAIPPAKEYFCAYEDGRWLPEENFPFPDCAVIQISNDILQPTTITLSGDLPCKDKLLINEIEQNLESKMEEKLSSVCENDLTCSVGSLKSVCEDEEDFNKIQVVPEKRKKRSLREYEGVLRERRDTKRKKSRISFEFMLEGSLKTWMQNGTTKSPELSDSLIKMLTSLQKEARLGNLDLRIAGRTLQFAGMSFDLDLHTYRCPEGSVLVNKSCVNCPVGTFFHVITERCQDCPKGTYQPKEGHNTCLRCPDNKSTDKPHSRSEEECKALCLPGTWSANGLEPCETCQHGFFQSDYSARYCHPCNPGSTTRRRGSRTEEECAEVCPAGHASVNGLAPCLPCPRNTYQPKTGKTWCLLCPIDGTTWFSGATSLDDCIVPPDTWEMQSDGSFKKGGGPQQQQQVAFNLCFGDPCENGGTCTGIPGSLHFTCDCPKGFTGALCENVLDLCEGQPCHNGGSCQAGPGSFICVCQSGFTGTNCEINIDECASSPCWNKGTCVDGINSFTCICAPGYSGPTCRNTVNDCADDPCRNGGTCIDMLSGFKCSCDFGFMGETCEIDIDECMSGPCKNGGSCKDMPGIYSCECPRGYTGHDCETDIDECADSPCQNGARCENLVDNYKCHCLSGFSGKKCEKTLTSLYQMDFASPPSIMDYAELSIDQPLNSVTVSFWLRTNDRDNQGTIFSYSVRGEPDAFTVTDYANLNLVINGEKVSLTISLNDGLWHHVVLKWSSVRGDWKLYVDGVFRDQGYNLSTAKPIPGKGKFIIGQEQDTFGGGFSPSETFIGSLTQLNVWDEELPISDINKLRLRCDQFHGNVIAWPDVQQALHGLVRSTPSSFCQDCATPDDLMHGTISFVDTKPSSEAEYRCDTGYDLVGNPLSTCLISGEWDFPAPVCYPINCGHPGRVLNGYVIGSDFSFNKTIRFQCQPGYELDGAPSLLCDSWGIWDKPTPKCVEIQCNMPELSVNTLPSSTAKRFPPGTEVEFSCRLGSSMQTLHNSVTCQLDGTWDRGVPSCDPEKCGYPPAIENGEPFTALPEYNVGEIVRYQCDLGYEFNPEASNIKRSVACLPSGNWESEVPVCGPIKCPDPPFIPNTIAEGSGRTFLSEVNYICLPGFQPVGKGVIVCEETRDWSSLSFRCAPLDCGAPPKFSHGSIDAVIYLYGSVATYQCDQGYTLIGDDTRQCDETGHWSGADPYCDPVSCGDVNSIPNGNVLYSDTTFQSTAQFSCDQGFELKGSEQITCEASGLWRPDSPTCEPRACPIPGDIEFGSYITSTQAPLVYNTSIKYECYTGYQLQGEATLTCQEDGTWSAPTPTCKQTECPMLQNPQNGRVNLPARRTYSSIAGFICNRGYLMKGTDSLICRADGTWSGNPPTCISPSVHALSDERIKCSQPDNPENGRADYKDLSPGSIVRYYCDKGYNLKGDSFRRCQDDTTLSGTKPVCEPIDCGEMEELSNGVISFSAGGTTFTNVATFTCNVGHSLQGDQMRRCESDGQWSGQMPFCDPVECPTVSTRIANGRANSTDSLFGAAVSYECDAGYKLQGAKLRTCQADGTWDQPIPSCESIECPQPQLANGHAVIFLTSFGTKVKYSCKPKYQLEGPDERTCMADGQWSGVDPRCLRIVCDAPEPVVNSETTVLNDTALRYECKVGYSLVGSSIRVCGTDRVWRPEAPYCQIITCDDLSSATLDNGNVIYTSNSFGEVVSYECNTGYELKGNKDRRCLPLGFWDGSEPSCEIISCGHPGILLNGRIIGDSYTFNSSVEFECDTEYKLVGVSNITCRSNGQWDKKFPDCERIYCPELDPTITNGLVTVTSRTVFGKAQYECTAGFHLIGDKVRNCSSSGEWSGKVPQCVNVFCIPPDPVEYGIMEGDKFGYGDAIEYICIEGYNLVGDFTRVCQQDGTWSNSPPTCLPVNCPEPIWPDYGYFLGETGTYESAITYMCEEGYELHGSSERICLANATWSGTVPTCNKISCGGPPAIDNAIMDQADDFLYGAKVVYSCIEGYRASGLDTTECLANRTWSYINFACTIISCPILTAANITHGAFQVPGITYRSRVIFACEEGYTLSGSSETVCTAQGSWSTQLPICLIVQCPKLDALIHGTVLSSSNDFGSTASFMCNTGYELIGAQEISCLSTGQWNDSQPLCELVSCPSPPEFIPNGMLNNPEPNYFYQDTCSYRCNYGYEISGDNLLTCLETGQFDLLPPACVRIPCPVPDTIEFGTFTLSDNDTVLYKCQEGFELVGNSILECLLGGKWNGLAPVCLPVVCPQPSPLTNGRIEGNEFTFGRHILYRCDLGYDLEGYGERVCQANQTWSEEEPQCVPISCGEPPEEFENGLVLGEYTYGNGVEYFCLEGFELSGEGFRLCQANGTWEGQAPICLRQSCPPPREIDMGFVSGDSYLFEDSITYSCVQGYELQGVAVRTCESSLMWSGLEPTCVRISCGMPAIPTHGTIIGDSYLFEDEVIQSCNFGYRLIGSKNRTCKASGLWSEEEAFCEKVFCPQPPFIRNGQNNASLTAAFYPVSHLVAYTCDAGYIMNGTGLKTCEPSGEWSENYIDCYPVSCSKIDYIKDGTVSGRSYIFLSVLDFSCNHGFELIGRSSLQCGETGEWDSEVPSCRVISCPFFFIDNGYSFMYPEHASNVTQDRGNATYIYGDTITFDCDVGFEVLGEATSQCKIDGTWSNIGTTCTLIKCPAPTGIENAIISESPLTFGSTVSISCTNGFDLIGESVLTCGADRKWEEPLPQCVLLACGAPPSVAHAVIEGENFRQGQTIIYRCRAGYDLVGNNVLTCGTTNAWLGLLPVCVEVDCGTPPVLPAATVTVRKTTFRSKATLKCNPGYILQGNATMICGAKRQWQYDPDLQCSPVDCGEPPEILHGSFSVDNTTLGGVAVYSCDRGHYMMGASSLFCAEEGDWVYEYPQCSPMDCHEPPSISHASYTTNGTLYLAVAQYTCDEGYLYADAHVTSMTCGDMGSWQGDIPACEVLDCGTPPDIQHAYYLLDNNRTDYLSYAIYHCKPGYEASNSDTHLTCSNSSLWEGTHIICEPLDCKDYPHLLNGEYHSVNGTRFGASVTYSCHKGYVKSGPDSITCTEKGVWSSDSVACLPVDCHKPDGTEHGSVGYNATTYKSIAVYSCSPGYFTEGNKESECLDTGLWSESAPSCSPVDCFAPPVRKYGSASYSSTTFGSIAVYSCTVGYVLSKSSSMTCGEDGIWLDEVPYCEIVTCPEPVSQPHSRVLFTNLTYKSVAIFNCEAGYQLVGESSPSCTENGSWSSDAPECFPLDCSNPIEINNGDVQVSGTTFGASATYTCHKGYKMQGTGVIYCNEEGAWNSSAPTCKITVCKGPPKVLNGNVLFTTTTYLSVATYQCFEGYRLLGDHVITCEENEEWGIKEKPQCQLILCQEPPSILHGEVRYTDLNYGSMAAYECDPGYLLTGPETIICGNDGSWLGNLPFCDDLTCPFLSDIPNGFVKHNGSYIGAEAVFSCSTGFMIEGESKLTCLVNGSWSAEVPTCKRVSCAPPPVIANAMIITDTGRNIKAKVTYSCMKGYKMVNDPDNKITITCWDDGDWFGKIPSCEIVVCEDLPPLIPHSTYVTSGDTYGSEALYTCDPGYTISGTHTIMCDHLGQWVTDDPPVCTPISCGPPPGYERSSYEGTDFTYSQTVNYTCDPGHDLIGAATSVCELNGNWSPVAFDCKVRECSSVIAIPEYGEIVSGADSEPFTVGSIIEFACDGEYTLVGSKSIRCAESGEWDSTPPQCLFIIDLCSETLEMDNVQPPPPGKVTGDQIVVQCREGYIPRGDMTSVCQAGGSWTVPQGRCEKVHCGKPEVKNVQNVMLMGRNYYYGDTVTFICRYGYVPVHSPPILTCLHTGQWDGNPDCVADCKEECLNGGFCIGFNRCKCMPGWAGHRCQTAVCILPCLHGGKCVAPYKCSCLPGYEGSRCQQAKCDKPCQHGGRCIRPNRCQCRSGYYGAFCEITIAGHKSMLNIT